jgi:hypothetical protein
VSVGFVGKVPLPIFSWTSVGIFVKSFFVDICEDAGELEKALELALYVVTTYVELVL